MFIQKIEKYFLCLLDMVGGIKFVRIIGIFSIP